MGQLKTKLQSRMWSRVAVLIAVTASCHAGLLGAGSGEGSCAAPPYRVTAVKWAGGCPAYASCCTEFGYCRGQDEWAAGNFRDCNGVSNGRPLEAGAIAAENAAAAAGDFSAANILVVAQGQSTYDLAAAPIAAAPIAVAANVPAATPAIAAGGFAAAPAGAVAFNGAAGTGFVAGNGAAFAAAPAGTAGVFGYAANGAAISGYDSNGNPIYASAVNSYLPPAY